MHISVLKNEILEAFGYLKGGDIFVDGTLGAAGHSVEIATKYGAKVIGIDRDEAALEIAKSKITDNNLTEDFTLIHNNFKNINEVLTSLDTKKIDGALLDLGVSSMQLDQKERGFSFSDPQADIDMRMDQAQDFSGKDVVNEYSEERLTKIFFDFGGEKFANKIAKEIIKNRPLQKMGDLIDAIGRAIPYKSQYSSGKHFATRTLQAIRIEVNRELEGLDATIDDYVKLLSKGSRLAIITFHSLEDKIVKSKFKELSSDCICPPKAPVCVCDHKPLVKAITRNPIEPSELEVKANPRSRSAKLRIIEKL